MPFLLPLLPVSLAKLPSSALAPSYDPIEGMKSPSHTHNSVQFKQCATTSGARQFPMCQLPLTVSEERYSQGTMLGHMPFSTSNLLKQRNIMYNYKS